MKIKIRYENEYQTLEVENVELERWLNISISEDESQEDYEQRIQDVIEERFNRPDYNSWHKHDRHTGNAYMKSKDGTVEVNTEEAIMFRAADKSAFTSSIDGVHNQLEYEECCETLRSLLKPAVADKLGSDMADSVTGGGLHGKDLSKADVSVNIHAFLKAQRTGKPVELVCAIGDDAVDGIPYKEIVEEAREFIRSIGGFEKFAEWGLY
ncbi:hypothetical protein ACQRBK_07540 [Peptoniphilaceae bacterium SGI.137]